jgi:protein TonB
MTLHNEDGSLLSKEVYSYEFDTLGNWTKMVTSVAMVEGGKMNFEQTEVTYRTLSYFLDEATLAKMSQPAAPAAPAAVVDNKVSASANAAAAPARPDAAEKAEVKPAKSEPVKMASAPQAASADTRMNVAGQVSVAAAGANNSAGGPVVLSEGEAPAKPIARGSLKPISGGILNGKAMALPSPVYPDMARRAQLTGLVTVEVIIDLNGRVVSAKAVEGPSMLQAAAEYAAKQARFSPTLLSGQPVRVSGHINYNFKLK